MSKQTAIDWLIDNLPQRFKNAMLISSKDIIEQAKEMEKEQIIDAAYEFMGTNFDPNKGRAEQYYNETYKGGEQ